MTNPTFVPKKALLAKAAAERESLYVQTGELARTAPLTPGVPTVVIELGSDNGPTAIGLLRLVELGADGRIVGVYLETEDDIANVVLQSSVGFRLIQGRFAEKQYAHSLTKMRQYLSETQEETEARMEQASGLPEGLAQVLAAASGGRIFGVEVEAEEDEPGPVPIGAKSKMQH